MSTRALSAIRSDIPAPFIKFSAFLIQLTEFFQRLAALFCFALFTVQGG